MIVSWKSLRLHLNEKVTLGLSIATAVFLLLSLALTIIHSSGTPDLLVIHVNIYNGIDWLGSWYLMAIIYGLVIITVAVNFLWSYFIYTRDKYMSYYLNVASLFMSLCFTLYLYLIASYS